MTHTQTQGADGAGTLVLLPLDDPNRPLNDSGLPSVMIWAGGEAYDELRADQSLDLDSCSLAVGIYRAMTEAHAKEIATLSPAPAATPGVPDSLRALAKRWAETIRNSQRQNGKKEWISLHDTEANEITALLDAIAAQPAGHTKSSIEHGPGAGPMEASGYNIAAQPAGQAGDAGAGNREHHLEEQLREGLAFIEMEGEAQEPGSDLYTWVKVTEQLLSEKPAPNSTRTGAWGFVDYVAKSREHKRTKNPFLDGESLVSSAAAIKPVLVLPPIGDFCTNHSIISRSTRTAQVGTEDFERALAAIRAAVSVNDSDTVAGLSPDSEVVWSACGSWLEPASVTLGDLRALAARPEAPSDAGWSFDMEAAPRDGTPINVGRDNGCGWDLLVVWWSKSASEYPWHTEGGGEYPEHRFDCWATLTPPSDPAPSGQAEG